MKELDCRGLACPAPVLKTKEALEKEALTEITVIVDNEAAKQNVSRFLKTKNFSPSVREEGGAFYISGSMDKESVKHEDVAPKKETGAQKIFMMITSNSMGHGDDELGKRLMVNFIKTAKEMDDLWQIVFMNGGVKLTLENSDAYNDLIALEKNGTRILSCGTCLSHFNLLDKKRAGETTNMLDIITSMQVADKVITV
jgi:selenium metabolism protein YedF